MLLAVATVAVALAACGEGPLLENVGDISQRVVYGTSSSTVPIADPETEAPIEVKSAELLTWHNAALADVQGGERAVITNRVWERGQGINRFVQAGPREIAAVLPEISFPATAPLRAEAITSQVVFDVGSGLVDSLTSAAFGYWAGTPYSVSREQGQVAVLRVGQASAYDDLPFGLEVVEVEDGLSFSWVDGDYRYELFCRAGIDERACRSMAENPVPLAAIAERVPVPIGT